MGRLKIGDREVWFGGTKPNRGSAFASASPPSKRAAVKPADQTASLPAEIAEVFGTLGIGTLSGGVLLHPPAKLEEAMKAINAKFELDKAYPETSQEELHRLVMIGSTPGGDPVCVDPTEPAHLVVLGRMEEPTRYAATIASFFKVIDECGYDGHRGLPAYFESLDHFNIGFDLHDDRIAGLSAENLLKELDAIAPFDLSACAKGGFVATIDKLAALVVLIAKEYSGPAPRNRRWWISLSFENDQLEDEGDAYVEKVLKLGFRED